MYSLALYALLSILGSTSVLPANASPVSSPVASPSPTPTPTQLPEPRVTLSIGDWSRAEMTRTNTTPSDKGGWGGVGPETWAFAFKPEGENGGYRREDFEVTLFRHEGNWTIVADDWAYGSDEREEDRVKFPAVDKKISVSFRSYDIDA